MWAMNEDGDTVVNMDLVKKIAIKGSFDKHKVYIELDGGEEVVMNEFKTRDEAKEFLKTTARELVEHVRKDGDE
jgi:hypothetical protein